MLSGAVTALSPRQLPRVEVITSAPTYLEGHSLKRILPSEVDEDEQVHLATLEMKQLTDKMFIGGLPLTTTEDMLPEHCSITAPANDAVVMRDGPSQRSAGFGFVQYDNAELEMAEFSKYRKIGGKAAQFEV